MKSFFFPTIRGLLRYPTLNAFINDVAEAANINKPLPGGAEVNYYRWWDQYYFVQDDWRVSSNLTLNLGVRYELPGNNIQSLIDLNDQILQVNSNNQVFALSPVPGTDKDNFQPRLGFNWQPTTNTEGILGRITGGDRFVHPRRLCADQRLRVPEHRAQHRELVPVRGGDQPQQSGERVRRAAGDAGRRAGGHRSEPADQDDRGGRLPGAGLRPVQLRRAAADRRRTWRCASGTSARSATTCSRRSTATRGCPSARSGRIRHEASSVCGRTRPSPGTTRCRRSSTSGSATA